MSRIVVLEDVPSFFIDELQNMGYEIRDATGQNDPMHPKELAKAKGVVIRSKTRVDEQLLGSCPELQFIMRPGSGLDNVDLQAVEKRGIRLINSPEGNKTAVAEHAVGMLLALLHNIPKAFEELKNGKWRREENRGIELTGKTIGIIGYGNTGSAFAEKLAGFGVKILVYDKYKTGFEEPGKNIFEACQADITKEADVISLHIPYNVETRHLVNEQFLNGLLQAPYLINTSRGGVVNTKDLINGLKQGLISGACLDVLENEDFDNYSDEENTLFNEMIATGRVLITPHIAGWSHTSEKAIYRLLLKKLAEEFNSVH